MNAQGIQCRTCKHFGKMTTLCLGCTAKSRNHWEPKEPMTDLDKCQTCAHYTDEQGSLSDGCLACDALSKRTEKAPEPKRDTSSRHLISKVCDDLKLFLLEKNESYGDSFRMADLLIPLPSGAKVDSADLLVLRINDKLKRLRDGNEYAGDDTWKDLAGYLVLLLVLREAEKGTEQ